MYVFVAGATATGKSDFAVKLAQQINGEVISCDSMQIYKGFDIGTAKISSDEMQGVPHHMLDICDAKDIFSVADYKQQSLQCAKTIESNGKIPIFCGGTGLYMNSVLFDYQFGEKLAIDKMKTPKLPCVCIVLDMERKLLRERLAGRVSKMFEKGLVQELELLISQGLTFENQSMRGIGYKEFESYFSGKITLDDVNELIIKNSKAYAKRQETWFRSWDFAKHFNTLNEQELAIEYLKGLLNI